MLASTRIYLASGIASFAVCFALVGVAGAQPADRANKLNEDGKALLRAKRYTEASDLFRQAIVLQPEGRFYYNLCMSLYHEGKLGEALTACRAVGPNGGNETVAELKKLLKQRAGSPRRDRVELVGLGFEWPNAAQVHGIDHVLGPGGYAFLPPGSDWAVRNDGEATATFHWIRKAYERVEGIDPPEAFVTQESDVRAEPMPDTDGAWGTQRFVDPDDVRHDMHVNIVNFEPGGSIPFPETHVMEHGLYVLEGKAVYRLNRDWVEVEAGDFMWLRAFCPQACYAGGPGRFRYLLYKDVNRHMKLPR